MRRFITKAAQLTKLNMKNIAVNNPSELGLITYPFDSADILQFTIFSELHACNLYVTRRDENVTSA